MTETTDIPVDARDAELASAIRDQFHVPNEMHQIATLLALQVVLLNDIRFTLYDLLEVTRNRT